MDEKMVERIIAEYMKNIKEKNIIPNADGEYQIRHFLKPNGSLTINQSTSQNSSILRTAIITGKNNSYRVVGGLGEPIALKQDCSLTEAIYYALDKILKLK